MTVLLAILFASPCQTWHLRQNGQQLGLPFCVPPSAEFVQWPPSIEPPEPPLPSDEIFQDSFE